MACAKHCTACGDSCQSVGVVCAECEPSVEFCPECYAAGVEIGSHKPTHAYRFCESGNVNVPLLSDSWTPGELGQLLEGLEQFGYGNWNDVSRYVDTKGANDCRDAVNNFFVDGTIGRATYEESRRGNASDHTPARAQGPATPSSQEGLPPPHPGYLSANELMVVGWLPSRDEFEVESGNNAETLVSCLEVGKSDEMEDEIETSLKLAQIEMYQQRLRDRETRRKAVKEFGLVAQFFKENSVAGCGKSGALKSKRRDSKSDSIDKLKMVAKFQTVEEHKKFMLSVQREKDLKSRIKELGRYRKNGVNVRHEAEEFDRERIRRNREKSERKRAMESGLDMPASPYSKENSKSSLDLDSLTTIVGLPGYDLLTRNEKRLCESLRLHPQLYTTYKICLLRDHTIKRRGQIPRPLHPIGLDKTHRKKIFSFLLQSGWNSAY